MEGGLARHGPHEGISLSTGLGLVRTNPPPPPELAFCGSLHPVDRRDLCLHSPPQVISTNAVIHVNDSEVLSILAVNGYARATVEDALLGCPLRASSGDWDWASFR